MRQMDAVRINTVDLRKNALRLKAGDRVLLSGRVFTARDAAHKRLYELLQKDATLPFNIQNACFYYAGPTPAPPGVVIGSCGPTTSGRMDKYTPLLLKSGLTGMIGKGTRSEDVRKAIAQYHAVYFCAIGGAGALAAKCILESEQVAFDDLGCESVKRLLLRDFPLIVGIDAFGTDIYNQITEEKANGNDR